VLTCNALTDTVRPGCASHCSGLPACFTITHTLVFRRRGRWACSLDHTLAVLIQHPHSTHNTDITHPEMRESTECSAEAVLLLLLLLLLPVALQVMRQPALQQRQCLRGMTLWHHVSSAADCSKGQPVGKFNSITSHLCMTTSMYKHVGQQQNQERQAASAVGFVAAAPQGCIHIQLITSMQWPSMPALE
jgi:hypothetical protein